MCRWKGKVRRKERENVKIGTVLLVFVQERLKVRGDDREAESRRKV